MDDSPTTANVVLVSGDDDSMIEVETRRFLTHFAGPDPDPFSLDVVRERDGVSTPQVIHELIRALKSPAFLGSHKTVWLRNFSAFKAEGTARSKTADAKALRELAELIETGIPPGISLLMNGPGLDRRKRLATVCEQHGKLVFCSRPNLRSREWQRQMAALIERRAVDKGMTLPPDVRDYLVDIIGTDTNRIDGELEKLICYAGGPEQNITRADAEKICLGDGEEISWALSDALGKRDVAEALRIIGVLLRHHRDSAQGARSLLAQTARYYRELLQAKVFMATRKLGNPRSVQRELQALSQEEQRRYIEDGLAVVGMNSYRVRILAEQAAAYQGAELIEAVRVFRDAYLKCITSNVLERVALEEAIMRVNALPRRTARSGRSR